MYKIGKSAGDDHDHHMRLQSKAATALMAEALAPAGAKPVEPDITLLPLPSLDKEIEDKEAEINRLCAEIENMEVVARGPFYGQRIARSVAKAHGVSYREMLSQRRQKHLVHARQHAMWELRKHTSLSMPAIGRLLGGRDHTTILYGLRAYEKRMLDAK